MNKSPSRLHAPCDPKQPAPILDIGKRTHQPWVIASLPFGPGLSAIDRKGLYDFDLKNSCSSSFNSNTKSVGNFSGLFLTASLMRFVSTHFHNQEQIIFKAFFQRFILADKLLVDECVLPHNNIGKIMCKKSPRRCFNIDMVERLWVWWHCSVKAFGKALVFANFAVGNFDRKSENFPSLISNM